MILVKPVFIEIELSHITFGFNGYTFSDKHDLATSVYNIFFSIENRKISNKLVIGDQKDILPKLKDLLFFNGFNNLISKHLPSSLYRIKYLIKNENDFVKFCEITTSLIENHKLSFYDLFKDDYIKISKY